MFSNLKNARTSTNVLTIMDPLQENIVLCINYSDQTIGVVSMQERWVLIYKYCRLNYTELYYLVNEKE